MNLLQINSVETYGARDNKGLLVVRNSNVPELCFCGRDTGCVFISYVHPANLRHASEPDSTTISLCGGHPANWLLNAVGFQASCPHAEKSGNL